MNEYLDTNSPVADEPSLTFYRSLDHRSPRGHVYLPARQLGVQSPEQNTNWGGYMSYSNTTQYVGREFLKTENLLTTFTGYNLLPFKVIFRNFARVVTQSTSSVVCFWICMVTWIFKYYTPIRLYYEYHYIHKSSSVICNCKQNPSEF